MGEVDGMAEAGADAGGGERMMPAAGEQFGESAELGEASL
jgi:hypothetical protein